MSFAYIGTDAFAAAVLERLVDGGRRPNLVVSRPDSRQGRGRRVAPPPVAELATRLGLELVQPESADDGSLEQALTDAEPDVLALCAYGAIIREPVLSRWTILNLHPSSLPRWRGAAPIERAIMAGDDTTGVSIIRLVEELDAGPVAMAEKVPIGEDDDFESLSAKLIEVGSALLADSLDAFLGGELRFSPQADVGITYAERILAADRLLDPGLPAIVLERTVRALRPHIGARLELPEGEIIGVRRATASPETSEPGLVTACDGELIVGCSEGTLRIGRVIPSGGREMDAADWLRGRRQPE